MIHELRIYHCLPGKFSLLSKRFETKTIPIWKKHGIRPLGFWSVLIGESNHDLYYLLEWENLAEREQRWDAFMGDPEWHSARAESEKDGMLHASLTNLILAPTSYSDIR